MVPLVLVKLYPAQGNIRVDLESLLLFSVSSFGLIAFGMLVLFQRYRAYSQSPTERRHLCCPRCNSERIKKSGHRWFDFVGAKFFSLSTFQCQGCRWKFLAPASGRRSGKTPVADLRPSPRVVAQSSALVE